MAKGRMINKSISKSKKFNLILDNDFDRLLYCMLLPYADRDGRVEGDPDLVKGNIFPRRKDVSEEDITHGLENLARVGLILHYQVEGDNFIQICQFQEGQEGFRYDREKPSTIPAPSGMTPTTGGSTPADDGENQEKNTESGLEGHDGIAPTVDGNTPAASDITPPELEIEIEENSPLYPPTGEPSEELSASDLIKETQLHWNSLPQLPRCKRTMASFSEPGKMATIIRDLGVDEVKGAMDRLAAAWETQESRYRPKSYQRFILGNLEYWANFEADGGLKETKSACAPEAPPEISDEERAEVQRMMEEEGGILGIIAKNREKIHETA